MPDLPAAKARQLLGARVTVEGRYQADGHGLPRLMFVKSVQSLVAQRQQPLPG